MSDPDRMCPSCKSKGTLQPMPEGGSVCSYCNLVLHSGSINMIETNAYMISGISSSQLNAPMYYSGGGGHSLESEIQKLRAENNKLYEAMSKAVAKGHAMTIKEWLPIETAPKDGTWILLGNAYERSSSSHYLVIAVSHDGVFFQDDIGDKVSPKWPTHWMPLPAKPK